MGYSMSNLDMDLLITLVAVVSDSWDVDRGICRDS